MYYLPKGHSGTVVKTRSDRTRVTRETSREKLWGVRRLGEEELPSKDPGVYGGL